MKYLLSLLFLIGCNRVVIQDPPREESCYDRIQDAIKEERLRIKAKDNPSLIYGTHVRITKGFYRTQTGTIVGQFYSEFRVKPDIKIKDVTELEIYPDDLEVIK